MRRFAVARLPVLGERVALEPDAAHHLLQVLRARVGESFELFDGAGQVAAAALVTIEDGVPWLEATEAPRRAAPPHARHLLIGLPKGGALDDALRMATEVGVTAIHPLLLARSVARGERTDRWERIVTSAAQQCGRGDVPTVHPLASLDVALARLPPGTALRVASPGAPHATPVDGPAAVLVGPEGGLTPTELARARAAGFEPMGLGAWVLRTPTAAAVALALL